MIIPLALWFPFLASFPFHPVKYHSAATVGPKNDKIVHYIMLSLRLNSFGTFFLKKLDLKTSF